jgi:drug/metabolite transporter (DMT)-like permease
MTTTEKTKRPGKITLADLGLLYASAIWGSTFIMVKNSLDSLNPVTLVAYRFLLAALLMGMYLILQRQPLFRNFIPGLILGIIQMFLYIPQTIGLQFTTAANSGFITGLFVAFVPPLSLLIPKQKPRPAQWAAVAVSLLGLWLVTGGVLSVNRGDLFTLSAAFTYALHVMLTDRYAKGISNHLQLVFQQFLVVGLLSLLILVVFDLPLSIPNLKAGGVIVFLGIFPTLSAYLVQIKAQVIASPIRVSLIFALEPVFAAIFAWTVGGEPFKPLNALGGLLIFLAVVLSTVHFSLGSDRSPHEGIA